MKRVGTWIRDKGKKTWWFVEKGVEGERWFSMDKKKVYGLYRDYPGNMADEDLEMFVRDNPDIVSWRGGLTRKQLRKFGLNDEG